MNLSDCVDDKRNIIRTALYCGCVPQTEHNEQLLQVETVGLELDREKWAMSSKR